MDRLIAKDTIIDLLAQLAYAQDELDRRLAKSLFDPEEKIFFDITSHLSDYTAIEITADELMNEVTANLAGYTATQHLLSNPVVTFDDDETPTKAHCKVQSCAYHCIQEEGKPPESVTARNTWNVDLAKNKGRWVFKKIVIARDIPLDNPALYSIAKARKVRREEKGRE